MRNDPTRRTPLTGALLIAVLTALALSSGAVFSSPPAQPPPPTEIRLSAGDEGRQVQLREGEVLVISLEANPSTGYAWEIEQPPLAVAATPILRQTGDQFVPLGEQSLDSVGEAEVAPPILGAPETQILRFQAVEAGQTTLTLVYRRPWEEGVPPADSFHVEVEAIDSFADVPAEADVESLPIEPPPAGTGPRNRLGLACPVQLV